jgi:hypothetical protein
MHDRESLLSDSLRSRYDCCAGGARVSASQQNMQIEHLSLNAEKAEKKEGQCDDER